MRAFWIGLLMFVINIVGFTSICMIGALADSWLRYFFFFLALPTMIAPAILWWDRYFDKTFYNPKKQNQ